MTRAELLQRLLRMQSDGENMDLPIIVTVNRTVPDKRNREGKRHERLFAKLDFAMKSTFVLRDKAFAPHAGEFAELSCHEPTQWI